MNNCPPELHSYIIRLACTDDGSTVRALLCVSRYFSALASPFIYQSMALEGHAAILKVAAALERIPSHRRKIRNLFISDKLVSLPGKDVEISPEVDAALIRILHLAAPTLETLTFIVTNVSASTSLIAKLFRITFPRLIELTIHGYYPYPSFPATLPILKRLHLSGNRNPHGLLQLGGLEAASPRLSHLRISGIQGAVAFADDLHSSLLPPPQTLRGTTLSKPKLPEGIHVVVVQPAQPSSHMPAKCGTMKRKELMMVDRLKFAAAMIRRPDGPLLHVVEGQPFGPSQLKMDWIDRLAGGAGCWVEPA